MPQLKQMSCCIQWADTNAPFQEYGTAYGDGVVETFIVVPSHAQGFCVRLTSRGYIHEGLAMVVFIDGNYQCNRSRLNLLPLKKGRPLIRTEVDFLLRQQEKPQGDGLYMGRAWRFDNHNIVPETPEGFQASHFDELGTIEVLVLRCRARNQEDTDYEGPSSGEDSDVFEERPARDEADAPASAQDPAAASAQVSTVVEAEPEDLVGGMFGLFDGANDMYEPNRRRSGQWVWHQRERPQGLPPDVPPSFQTASDMRFRTTSHVPPNTYYQQQQANLYPNGHQTKQVHFDFGNTQAAQHSQYYGQHPQNSYRQAYEHPERPVSRERVRSGDRRRRSSPPPPPPTPTGPPYEPQSVASGYNDNHQSNAPPARTQSSAQPQHHENTSTWTTNDGHQSYPNTRSDRNPAARETAQASRPHQPVYNPQEGLSPHNYVPNQPADLRDQYFLHGQNPLPHLSQPVHIPPYFQSQPLEFLPPPPPPPSMVPPYATHILPPTSAYPPQMMLPQSYAQPGGYPYPYWPHHTAGPYAYPEPRHTIAQHVIEEEISPKNTTHDIGTANEGAQNSPTDNYNGDDWANAGNAMAADTADANHGDQVWTAAGNDADNNWPQDQNDNNTPDNGGGDWNNDTNNNSNNNANGNWGDDTANNAAAGAWDDSANIQSSDGQQPNNGPTNEAKNKAEVKLLELATAARDLYGPHGPYYSFRALRLDEPKPDAQEEPRYDVPKTLALTRGSTKQVQPGPGYRYYKRRLKPEYIDTMDQPYARFVFKYRTKAQLANEIGITVDVEPSGDHEIQDLQNLDKQALIEMLMRAKTALGGKVPGPPPTPSTPATASDAGPVAVEAPKLPYLKYSLPPLRPSNFSKKSTPSNSAVASKTSLVGKENVAPVQNSNGGSWNNSSADSSNEWNNNGNTANGNQSWNNSPAQTNTPKPGSQSDWNANDSRQTSKSSGSKRAPAREETADDDCPPRPPTPDGAWTQNTAGGGADAAANWDNAAPENNNAGVSW